MAERRIEATVGQPVQVVLQSMAGSTGYSWYVQSIDGGLALSRAYATATGTGIAPINQVFEFLATTEGTFSITFVLLAPWRPGEPGDSEKFEVQVKAPQKSAAEDIASAMRGREFVSASAVNVGAASSGPTVLKYAAPMAMSADPCLAGAVAGPVPPYAAPVSWSNPWSYAAATMIAYAAPMGPSTVAVQGPLNTAFAQAAPWAQVIYAAPMSQAAWAQAIYAAPMSQAAWAQVIYAAPMSQANAAFAGAQPVYAAPVGAQPVYAAPMSMQPLYAAPMSMQPLYAAPMSMQPVYAAPMSMQPVYAAPMSVQPVYAAPMSLQPLYAAPMAQAAGLAAAMMQPYAAPYTGGRCC